VTHHRVELQLPPDVAWERLQAAAASVGTIESADQATRSVVVRKRRALGPVRLRATVSTGGSAGASVVDIQGGGVVSRRQIARLVARLTHQ
jgi:hypothetical protein